MKISKLTSYAKINLDLKIKYYDKIIKKHKISSKVVLLKLNDLIKVSNSTKLQITYYDQNKKIIKLKNDIIKKSILFFDRKYKTKTKLKFLVYKKIPVGYGLGGGSSNAASILKFLYKYHQITSKNFEKDAPLIGSDVIIFKNGKFQFEKIGSSNIISDKYRKKIKILQYYDDEIRIQGDLDLDTDQETTSVLVILKNNNATFKGSGIFEEYSDKTENIKIVLAPLN